VGTRVEKRNKRELGSGSDDHAKRLPVLDGGGGKKDFGVEKERPSGK